VLTRSLPSYGYPFARAALLAAPAFYKGDSEFRLDLTRDAERDMSLCVTAEAYSLWRLT
jgi:hypothetical protein